MVRRVGVLLLGFLAALLTGCGGSNPKPSAVSDPASPSLSSASATTAPTMPAAAKGTTPASAEAFVRYYFATYSYAARTGDTKPMRSLASDDCKSCDRVAGLIEKTYQAGGSAVGRGYATSRFSNVDAADDAAELRATVTQFAQHLVPSASANPTDFPENSFRARFELAVVDGRWQMSGWFVL